jgi:hypothetical protein
VQRRGKHACTTIELLLGKHVPAATVTHATGETGCCLSGPCRGVIKKRKLGLPSQSSSAREGQKRWRSNSFDILVAEYSPDSNDVTTESEESPLLRTLARERLLKTQQAGKRLSRVLW